MPAVLLLALVLAGCQLVFELEGPRVCTPGDPFPVGQKVKLASSQSVEAARFLPDRQSVYLSLCSTSDKSSCDLFQGSYFEAADEYGAFAQLTISATDIYDSYPTITPGADFILFGSERLGDVQVFVAPAVEGQFVNAMRLDVAGEQFSNEPYMLGDGRTLYVSAGSNGGNNELYRGSGTPPGFGGFDKVPGVNTGEQEFAPVVSDDEREIFFASNRQQPGDVFALDLYTATRPSSDVPFDPPRRLDNVSSSTTVDWPLWLSGDGCDLYYINKDGDQATLFVTTR